MKTQLKWWFIVVSAIVGLAFPTFARAHGAVPFTEPNVIHACRGVLGILRQVTTGTCGHSEAILHWSDSTGATPRPDGPCLNNTSRYVNCGNGTVTDTVTGLIWLQQSECLSNKDWAAAIRAASELTSGMCGLTDGSSPGDWRLPTLDEWQATVAVAAKLGCTFDNAPALTNGLGTGCFSNGGEPLFTGLVQGRCLHPVDPRCIFWTSTAIYVNVGLPDISPGFARNFGLDNADFGAGSKSDSWRVWPVRSGLR